MKLAIYGRLTQRTDFSLLGAFFEHLSEKGVSFVVFDEYAENLLQQDDFPAKTILAAAPMFSTSILGCDYIFSFGGDGTMLDTARLVGRTGIPIVGVNVGRMGFLANVGQAEAAATVDALLAGDVLLEARAVLELETTPDAIFPDGSYAINDITLHKSNSNEMIIIHTFINGDFLNSYWTDGLIISTPTGSTAYSLACGGPIITPQAGVLVLTPIAPHSLTVRPFIISDDNVVSFEIESRSGQALVAVDNRNVLIQDHFALAVRKADFKLNLVKNPRQNYFTTLRNRLNWGVDSRN